MKHTSFRRVVHMRFFSVFLLVFLMLTSCHSPSAPLSDKEFALKIVATEGGSIPAGKDTIINGQYKVGERIDIQAREMPGYRFDRWTSENGGEFEDDTESTTVFVMPEADVVLTAHFVLLVSNSQSPSAIESQNGRTEVFEYNGLKLEVTGIQDIKTGTQKIDSGDSVEYNIYVCYSEATVSVLNADMSDAALSADGKAHPNWAVLLKSGERMDIVDDMEPLVITSDIESVFSPESSVIVLGFEMSN